MSQHDDNIIISGVDIGADETIIDTSYEGKLSSYENKVLLNAIEDKGSNQDLMYSNYFVESTSDNNLTLDNISLLASGIHNNLENVVTANNYIRKYIVIDDIIGKTYEAIDSNINTEVKFSYTNFRGQKIKNGKLDEAKKKIELFNKQINLKKLIRESIPITYAEGNYILYLRDNGSTYVVDHYPLGVAYVSDYNYGGNPVICVNIDKLRTAVRKTYDKDRKNKSIFAKNIDDDIKNNYPPEVYAAYKANEKYVRLDPNRAKIIRIGNIGRKYGVSPIFRALKSALLLQNYEESDFINARAKAKKIIHQVLRKEAMGVNYDKKGFDVTAKAHEDLVKAFKLKTTLYTSIPQVQEIKYIEPKVDDTNVEKIQEYRSKIMTTLGIGFVDNKVANFSVANISLNQLMKTINAISEQLEAILYDYYSLFFELENIDSTFLPSVSILDSEQLEFDMKKSIAEFLYNTLNCSLETSLKVLGYDIEDEKQKRQSENDDDLSEVFFPRATSYTTSSSDSESGRPADSDDPDKQANDKSYNKTARQ